MGRFPDNLLSAEVIYMHYLHTIKEIRREMKGVSDAS
jgi:hypothetical protein